MNTTTDVQGLTTIIVKNLYALSGGKASGFDWHGIGGTSRPAASTRRGLRLWMAEQQQGLCADCGKAGQVTDPTDIETYLEFCHVVSRGLKAKQSDQGRGWTPGNLFLGHRCCGEVLSNGTCSRGNKAQQSRGPVVLPEHLLRPDLVCTSWPGVPYLKAIAPTAR